MKCVVLQWQQWLGDNNQKLRNLNSSKCKAILNFGENPFIGLKTSGSPWQ